MSGEPGGPSPEIARPIQRAPEIKANIPGVETSLPKAENTSWLRKLPGIGRLLSRGEPRAALQAEAAITDSAPTTEMTNATNPHVQAAGSEGVASPRIEDLGVNHDTTPIHISAPETEPKDIVETITGNSDVKKDSELDKVNSLLRTNEEVQAAVERGESPSYTLERNGQSIVVEGGKHEWNDTTYLDALTAKTLNRNGARPDMVFVELNSDLLAQLKDLPADTPPLEIAKKYSEQGYVAWQAIRQGVQVKAWDLAPEDQIREAAKVKEPKAVVEWMIGQSIDSLRRNYNDQIPQEILNGFKDRMVHSLQKAGIDLTQLSKLTVAGVEVNLDNPSSLLQITRSQAEVVSSPRTNEISAYISQLRNENAIKEIYGAQREGIKSIAVTCGSEHALVWRDALSEIYKTTEAHVAPATAAAVATEVVTAPPPQEQDPDAQAIEKLKKQFTGVLSAQYLDTQEGKLFATIIGDRVGGYLNLATKGEKIQDYRMFLANAPQDLLSDYGDGLNYYHEVNGIVLPSSVNQELMTEFAGQFQDEVTHWLAHRQQESSYDGLDEVRKYLENKRINSAEDIDVLKTEVRKLLSKKELTPEEIEQKRREQLQQLHEKYPDNPLFTNNLESDAIPDTYRSVFVAMSKRRLEAAVS